MKRWGNKNHKEYAICTINNFLSVAILQKKLFTYYIPFIHIPCACEKDLACPSLFACMTTFYRMNIEFK